MAESAVRRAATVLVLTLTTVACPGGRAWAQDPLVTLPSNYKLEFENEDVRVVRVRYEPRAQLPAHDHPKGPTAYVYLNDGGPVLFKHIGLSYGAITRPATVAGAVRLARAVEEIHEVENPNDTPSEFLRVEFKRLSEKAREIRGRFYPEPRSSDENFSKVLFENDGLRVRRLGCAPARPCDLGAPGSAPALVVTLAGARLAASKAEPAAVAAGHSEWLPAGTQKVVENRDARGVEFLSFEFKVVPSCPSACQ